MTPRNQYETLKFLREHGVNLSGHNRPREQLDLALTYEYKLSPGEIRKLLRENHMYYDKLDDHAYGSEKLFNSISTQNQKEIFRLIRLGSKLTVEMLDVFLYNIYSSAYIKSQVLDRPVTQAILDDLNRNQDLLSLFNQHGVHSSKYNPFGRLDNHDQIYSLLKQYNITLPPRSKLMLG